MKSLILSFLRDEDGQTSTEYILLVAVVAMIVIKFREKLGKQLENITDSVFDKTNSFVDELDAQ
ncbi:MAG: Flp family type IVb pilin [Bacteriovoracaceae bacterium]